MTWIEWSIVSTLLVSPVLFQTPVVTQNPQEDKLRAAIAATHDAFMKAHPDLESRLAKDSASMLHQDIADSRRKALANMAANAAFYDYLILKTIEEGSRISGQPSVSSAQLTRQLEADHSRRDLLEKDVQSMRSRAAEIEKQLANSTGRERERLKLDLEAVKQQASLLDEIKVKVDEELGDLQIAVDGNRRDQENVGKLANLKKDQAEKYRQLKANFEKGREQYERYFNALDAYVDGRDSGKPGNNPKQ